MHMVGVLSFPHIITSQKCFYNNKMDYIKNIYLYKRWKTATKFELNGNDGSFIKTLNNNLNIKNLI